MYKIVKMMIYKNFNNSLTKKKIKLKKDNLMYMILMLINQIIQKKKKYLLILIKECKK